MSFEASVRYSGDIAIVDLTGRIVLNDGSAGLRESIAKLRQEGASKILLNMAEVSFMDSSGLGRAGQRLFVYRQGWRATQADEHPGAHSGPAAHHQTGHGSNRLFPNEPAALDSFSNGAAKA